MCVIYFFTAERDTLMALFHATNGSAWKKKNGWGTEDLVGKWQGVTVGYNGYVTGLDLNWINLCGASFGTRESLVIVR